MLIDFYIEQEELIEDTETEDEFLLPLEDLDSIDGNCHLMTHGWAVTIPIDYED